MLLDVHLHVMESRDALRKSEQQQKISVARSIFNRKFAWKIYIFSIVSWTFRCFLPRDSLLFAHIFSLHPAVHRNGITDYSVETENWKCIFMKQTPALLLHRISSHVCARSVCVRFFFSLECWTRPMWKNTDDSLFYILKYQIVRMTLKFSWTELKTYEIDNDTSTPH